MEIKRIISIFFDRDKPEAGEDYFLHKALERIQSGESRELIERIRAEPDKAKRNKLKGKLPCVCFSGHFLKRENTAITQHSGHIVLDFDDAADPVQLKIDLFRHPFVKACWLSPSGTGIKCLVRVPAVITQHRGHFAALEKLFPGVDASGKDEARICYEGYDPALLLRDNPDVFEGYEVPGPAPATGRRDQRAQTDYAKINSCVAMIRKALPGSRNETLLKAARLAGGFVAGGFVPEAIAYQILEDEVRSLFPADEVAEELHTIRNGIEYGKTVPIYDQTPEEQPVPKTETTHSIKFLSGVWDKMKHQHKNGKERGTTTHLDAMDGRFSWKKKQVTLFTGYANNGKSEFIAYLALLKSVFDGTKWAVFSPESGDPDEFYDGLIHALVGRSTDPVYGNQMTMGQYREAAEFVMDHFYLIDPDSQYNTGDVEANFEYCIRELNVEGVILDPFNALEDKEGDRDDKHLKSWLNGRLRFAKLHNVYYVIAAHPNASAKLGTDGEYAPPGYFSMAGGAMWSNKVHNFIIVHRPFFNSDPDNTSVDIIVKKIKQHRLVGTPGTVRLGFERGANRYTFWDGKLNRAYSPLEKINSNAEGRKTTKLS